MIRPTAVEVPDETYENGENTTKVGLLNKSLCGTRDAARNWQEEIALQMGKLQFRRGKYNPCLYLSPEKNIKVLVHGDDFLAVGSKSGIENLEQYINKLWQTKVTKISRNNKDHQEGRMLNRILRACEDH